MRFPVALLCLLTLCLATACKRRDSTAATPATQPSPAAAKPAIVPSTRATLTIDAVDVTFPAMQMRVTDPGDGAAVTLATIPSDDPDDNVLSLDMQLPEADPKDLSGAEWHFKSDDKERAVTLNTIVLNGGDVELQPADFRATFQRDGTAWLVTLDGDWYLYEGPDALEPRKKVVVAGRVRVTERK